MNTIRPPVCPGCGWPLPAQAPVELCERCRATPFELEGLRAYGLHTGTLREAVHQLKYGGLTALAPALGQAMSRAWPDLAPGCDCCVVVPVPLHRARQRERGYNQAALLARELAHGLGRPVIEGCLLRTRHTRPQVGLTGPERRSNVANAFYCAPGSLAGQHVLLVDDVCTTGATLESAAAAVREAGAQSVWAYTLARAT
jgi:ComF family protein